MKKNVRPVVTGHQVDQLIPRLTRKELILDCEQLKRLRHHQFLSHLPAMVKSEQRLFDASVNHAGVIYPPLIAGKTQESWQLLDGRARISQAIRSNQALLVWLLDIDEPEQEAVLFGLHFGCKGMTDSQKALAGASLTTKLGGKLSYRGAGDKVGISYQYISDAVQLHLAAASEATTNQANDLIRAVQDKKHDLSEALRELRTTRSIEKERQAAVLEPAKLVELRLGRFQDRLKDIPDKSVRLLLTDPMYALQFEPDWLDMGEFIDTKVMDGGMVVIMVGCVTDDELLHAVRSRARSLRKISTFTAELIGPTCSHASRKVRGNKRDFHAYVKSGSGIKLPTVVNGMPEALFRVNGADKRFSKYGQRVEAFLPFIQWYTNPNDLVVDPFAGGGAVPAACEKLSRRCIACEKDPETFERVVGRLFGARVDEVRTVAQNTWGSTSLENSTTTAI
jgi:hypothetical protein